ncbi:MAG TPA: DUF502 domain-containing protein [Chitinophagaceae bacterium]|nr:DUF502 domain-containing protein [Chitinophagaceae bacterium]
MQRLRPLLQYFFQGLIILAPIVLTAWAVISLFNFIDGILPNLLNTLFPSIVGVDANGDPKRYPGLGFLVVIMIVILIGYLSSSFIFGRIVHFFDLLLEKTPGVKVIYTTLKDFFEAFAGNKKKFNRAVLVCIEAEDVWQLGFVTQQDVHEFGLREYISVYIPHSYAFSGRLYFVKRDRIKVVDHMNATEAMKFAISGGVAEAEEIKSDSEIER